MYLTQEIFDALDGAPMASFFANGAADAQVTDFLRGARINVSREQRKWKKSLQPDFVKIVGADEVWECCFRHNKPGWRLFGRFLDRAVFVGLRLYDKLDTGNSYDAVVREVLDDWAALLPGVEPVRSEDLDDYLGYVWRDIDEPE